MLRGYWIGCSENSFSASLDTSLQPAVQLSMPRNVTLEEKIEVRLSPAEAKMVRDLALLNRGTEHPDTVSHVVRELIRREAKRRRLSVNLSPQPN